VRGRELLRKVTQHVMDARAAAEPRLAQVTGADGVPRRRAERDHARTVVTWFGPVVVRRLAYRAPGAANLHRADAVLNLPGRRYSWQVQQAAVRYALAGSYEQAQLWLQDLTGVSVGKQQLEQIVAEAARDAPGFYPSRPAVACPAGLPLAISADGKGVAMRPGARRAETARKARKRTRAFASGNRLGPGEKAGTKRIAETGAVFDVVPPDEPRTPEQILGRVGGQPAPEGPEAVNRWYTVEITATRAQTIAAVFDQAERRDPGHARTWIALVDGDRHQIEVICDQAAERDVSVMILVDFIHVLELSTVPARDQDIFAGHSDVAIDVTTLRCCGRRVPAEPDELAAELQVLAVGLLECGAQGLGFVAVLFLEVSDLAGQRVDDRVVAVAVAGRGRLRAGLGAQPLDPGAQVSVPVEECVGHAGLALDGLEGDGLAALDQPADRLAGGGGLRFGLGFGCGREDGGAAGSDVAHGWSFR
jgi:hypothetical protein